MTKEQAEQQINEIQQQIRQRMDQLAQADPTCGRLLGRLDVLKEIVNEKPAEPAEEKKT